MQTSPNPRRSPHGAALSACFHHFVRILGLLLLNLLVRGVALLPLILALAGHNVLGFPRAHVIPMSLLACLPLYALIVMPFVFFTRSTLFWVVGWRDTAPACALSNFGRWLLAGLLRLLRALPFVAPIAALTITFYVYWTMAGFNEFGLMINDIGALIGGDYAHGIALIALAFIVFTLLAVLGWRRDLPFAFLSVDAKGIHRALKASRAVRRRKLNGLGRTSLINFLITLPAIGTSLYFIADYLRSMMVGDLQWDLTMLLTTLTTFDFPQEVYVRIGIALVILYLPFVLWRKAALAHTIGRVSNKAGR